jgi:lysophospholipase L1-like esterase
VSIIAKTLSRAWALAAILSGCVSVGAEALPAANWVGSWASSQQIPEARNALDPAELTDATLRQIVHLTIGGKQLRVRLSNAFGTEPLHIASVHIALPLSASTGSVDVSTDKALTFSGSPEVTIPAGADYISDPVGFPAAAFSNLAISLYLETPPGQQTSHPGSRETSFLVHGDQVSSVDLLNARLVDHWYQLSGVDVTASPQAASIVVLGDSITDGRGSTTNGNDRWPDDLARRFQASPATRALGVLNVGIGGNRLLLDGLGPSALARFNRDVLAQTGVRCLIVLEGINDLGMLTADHEVSAEEHQSLVRRVIGAYEQIVARAHARAVWVMGATITPDMDYTGYHPTPLNESDRQTINAWIRTPGHFDALVDFDKVVRDPAHPDHLLPLYDSGDHLHLSPAGYRAMAEAVPLSFFAHVEALRHLARHHPKKASR